MSARSITTSALTALAIVSFLGACTTGAGRHELATLEPRAGSSRSLRVLSASDIQRSGAMTMEDAVRRLRPQFLRPRRSATRLSLDHYTPLVYVDGVRAGGLESLSSIPALQVKELRFLTESEANVTFTGMHPGGAIALKTR